ncbi:BCL-6 corepressor [Chanos chanos]|uniref:BCL-6 corepressor n=1 Tax=Chanos chanos TaxID=29144 RepID=A0A6J2VZM3_CHACN|nr:BCL-6 corepressor [Chanos chanos]
MVDASAACRMNPLAGLGIDHGSLMRESLRVHGGMVYPPGIRTLPTEKGYAGDRVPDLLYKPDVSLDSRKATNGYVDLYKSPPPGLQKPIVVPGATTDALGLDRRVGPADKPSELGLNGSSSFLRLPWVSPYHDAGMYPFLDSSKYAALNMYKASFMSQPSPYLPQHLTYQSLCAGAGGSAAGTERLFYMPPYTPAPISSPLAPPLRIPTATVAPTALSPLMHCQDKSIQSIGPRIHHEPSAFGQQLHQQAQSHHQSLNERQHSNSGSGSSSGSSKSSRIPSSKTSSSSNSSSSSSNSSSSSSTGISSSSTCVPVDSTATLVMQSPRPTPRPPQPSVPPPPPPPLVDSTLDFQKSLFRSPSSSSSSSPAMSHPFYMSAITQEHRSPARSASQKPKSKEGSVEHRSSSGERKSSKSPSKTSSEKPPQQAQTKDPADKPLDLSAKIMEFEGPPNGFPPKLEALAKLGYSSTARYGPPTNRDLLKDALSPASAAVSTSSKTPERPEIISTLQSSWMVPSPAPAVGSDSSQNKSSTVIKNKNLEQVMPQQRSSSCPRIGEANNAVVPNPTPVVVTPAGRPASASPSPKNGEWPKSAPTPPEKPPATSRVNSHPSAVKPAKTLKKPEGQEISFKPQQPHLENGHPPSHLYMPQGDAYLSHSLAYANRYLPYPVPDSMSLPHLQLPGKGPVYPHPVLLGSNSLYPARLPPKHGLPYGIPPSHGDYMTYHDSQEMVHPLMSSHMSLDPKVSERLEVRSRPQEKPWHHEESPYKRQSASDADTSYKSERESEKPEVLGSKPQSKTQAVGKDEIVCIDLVQDDTDGSPQTNKYSVITAKRRDPTKPDGSSSGSGSNTEGKEPELMQILRSGQPAEARPAESERQPEPCSQPRPQEQPDSPRHSQGEESPSEQSPLPDMLEEQTLRCARTSGDRKTAGETDFKPDRHHAIRHYMNLGKDCPEDTESHEDEEEGHGSSKNKRSSLAKRIANSSGYVGDRFKCVTTELYADSSKLSREQRALQMEVLSQEDSNLSQPAANRQRAMMRFSELELKEKEGGVLAGRELADSQQRGEGDWERSQHSSRPGPTALTDNSQRNGVQPTCTNNRVPVLQRCGVLLDSPQPRRAEEKREKEEREKEQGGAGAAAAAAAVRDVSSGSLSVERQAVREASHGPASARKHTLSLEHGQAHPDTRQGTRERENGLEEEEEEEEEETSAPAKRAKLITDAWPDRCASHQPSEQEVKKLKVCIELTGLRLSKPHPLHHLQELWEGQLANERTEVTAADPVNTTQLTQVDQCRSEVNNTDRKVKVSLPEDKVAKRRSEVERSWCKETLGYTEPNPVLPAPPLPAAQRGFSDPSAPDLSGRKASPLAPSRLSDKRHRVKEHRKAPPHDSSSPDPDSDLTPRLRRHGDPEKPKGKRQCKTKHLSQRERRMLSQSIHDCPELSPQQQHKVCVKRSASLSDYESSPTPPVAPAPTPNPNTPAEPPVSRPMPPEARRLIVNKNAGETLLQRAARLGYEEVVLYCLENKVCDVNHRDNAGYCALHEACARGWLSIVQHLVEHGADINCSAQDGTRPLHDAVENDHLDVVRLLLSYGADPTLATYSGRSLLKMTHSDLMEGFLTDYFADLQGRDDDDPKLCWDFYGSSVCEPGEDSVAFDILANPPGPGEDEEEQREVFEFEFSDRPLLPCYNIQVSLSQGPRNWLLLSDVLKRLKMSARAFRTTFTHIEVATIAEAEFYKQASLSQLFSSPDELEGFLPDSKELLDLVEISGELVALLGSSLECLDDRWEPVPKARS